MTGLRIARGGARIAAAPLPSPIPGVAAEAWTRFVRALRQADPGAISPQGFLGCFEIHPRRLAELGDLGDGFRVATAARDEGGVWRCDFACGTQAGFLASFIAQYAALVKSVRGHYGEVARGAVAIPAGVTLSGALAILHRAGRGGLAGWTKRKLPETAALFDRANGIFEVTR